jgi:hypothetical protein
LSSEPFQDYSTSTPTLNPVPTQEPTRRADRIGGGIVEQKIRRKESITVPTAEGTRKQPVPKFR